MFLTISHVPFASQNIEENERRKREDEERKKKQEEEKKAEEEKEIVYVETPFVAREWKSHGSEAEVERLTVKENRPRCRQQVSRKRREFGRWTKGSFAALFSPFCNSRNNQNCTGDRSAYAHCHSSLSHHHSKTTKAA